MFAVTAVSVVLLANPATSAPAIRPNIIYILADDLGIGDVSCYNEKSAWKTPHLDALARDGMKFTEAHSASGVCTPSRYALLTGRYAWRGRLKEGVVNGYAPSLIEPGRLTVAGFLRTHDYTTAMFGKWHLGLDWVRRGGSPEAVDFARPFRGGPIDHGFDRFFGISASLDMPPYVWLEDDRATTLPSETVDDSPAPKLWRAGVISADFKFEEVQPRLTEKVVTYIADRAKAAERKPFFLYLALAGPHTPVVPTAEFEGKSRSTAYGDFVTQIDADVGRILTALEDSGLSENTLVIFTSDNGFAPPGGLEALREIAHDPSGGFRGFKSDLFEGGHHVPLIVRWPGGIAHPNTSSAALVGQLDLFATCAEILGAGPPGDAAEDSVSFLSVLRGDNAMNTARTSLVHHSSEGQFSIREGRWKLLLWAGSGGWSAPTPTPSRWLKNEAADLSLLPAFQLYDMAVDPAEQTNLAASHPEIVQRLGRLMSSTIKNGRSTPGVPTTVTIGPDWPQTAWLKAFDR
jgi:arylsulfatase A-like enzyme